MSQALIKMKFEKIALVIRPQKKLSNYLYQKVLDFKKKTSHIHFRPKFDPHTTILYLPLIEQSLLKLEKKLRSQIRNTLPMEIQYRQLYCSNFNSVNLMIHPNQHLIEIHQKLLADIYPGYPPNTNPSELFAFYDTSNIGALYTPHLTIDKFSSKGDAASFISLFDDFIPTTQKVSNFDLMDASYSPLRFYSTIK